MPAPMDLQSACPASVDRLSMTPSLQPPSRAQTVTNNLALVTGSPSAVKDVNLRGAGSMEGVETVRVTDITTSSAFTKSIGSLFSSINRSMSSAFNSLMAAPPPLAADGTETGIPAQPLTASVTEERSDSTPQHHQQHSRPYQQSDVADWHRVPQAHRAAGVRGTRFQFHQTQQFRQ